MSQDQVMVPPEVYDGLDTLYQSGELDPGDREGARRTAAERDYEYVEEWLEHVGDEIYARAARGEFTAHDRD